MIGQRADLANKILRRTIGDELRQLTPDLWQLTFHFPATTNCWLFRNGDGLTLIDAGNFWNAGTIVAAAKLLKLPLKRIIITHAHPDHAGSAAELSRRTGAPVMAHEADVPYLNGEKSMANLPGFWLCKIVLNGAAAVRALAPPKVERVQALSNGDEIGSLKVIHTPGHTPGSLSLWADSQNAIFCGDNLSNIMNLHLGLSMFTLNLQERNESIERYADLPAKILLCGHGPAYFSDPVVADLQRLL